MIEKTIELRFIDGSVLRWDGEKEVNHVLNRLDSYPEWVKIKLGDERIHVNKKNLIHVRVFGGK